MKKMLNLGFSILILLQSTLCFSQSSEQYFVTNSGTRINFNAFFLLNDDTLYLISNDSQKTFVILDSIAEYHFEKTNEREELADFLAADFSKALTKGMSEADYETAYGFALAGSICEKWLVNASRGSRYEYAIMDFRNNEADEKREYFRYIMQQL